MSKARKNARMRLRSGDRRRVVTICDMRRLAAARDGLCLSSEYVNTNTKLEWQCANGHRWFAVPNSVKRGSWCRECANEQKRGRARPEQLSIEEFREIARTRGGECLSDTYVNAHSKLRFRCSEGHEWEAKPNNVKHSGTWCNECAARARADVLSLGIDVCKEMATRRGGECLAKSYVNTSTKLKWKCSAGHTFLMRPGDVRGGQWCPRCSAGLGERITRCAFEEMFGTEFPRRRPDWLRNSRGNRMELDGFCEELGLAFEHQGEQHYSLDTPFIASQDALSRRQADDTRKLELCAANDVVLVVIPEVPRLLPIEELPNYVFRAISETGWLETHPRFADGLELRDTDFGVAFRSDFSARLDAVIAERGGTRVTRQYPGALGRVTVDCSEGHRWSTVVSNIVNGGSWCPTCSRERRTAAQRKPIEEIQKLALANGGLLLSTESLGAHRLHRWRCADGHDFRMTPANVLMGKWCRACANAKRGQRRRADGRERFLATVASHGGRVVEGEYEGAKAHLLLACKHQHEWLTTPANVNAGAWCPRCRGGIRKSIQEVQSKAASLGGKLLSAEYRNVKQVLQWRCSEGHVFESTLDRINKGRWCTACEDRRSAQ